jgi:phenylacetate-CoA ligase
LVNVEAARIRATRYGGDFDERLHAAIERYERGPEALVETQAQRLERALARFSRCVPRFRHLSAATVARDPYGVLAELETTDKTSVRNAPEAFVARPAPGSIVEQRTSGTTGAALHFLSTRDAVREQWAIWWRYRSWFGLRPGTWHGLFGGKPIVASGAHRRHWRVAYPLRQVFYSSLHISDATAAAYLEDIDRRGLTWLHGYPSAVSSLARTALASGLSAPVAIRTVTGARKGCRPWTLRS